MADYYNRYNNFVLDGQCIKIPPVKIPYSSTDIILTFDKSKMRFDMLSYKYYGDPNYGWLILQANQSLGSLEFAIPNKSRIIIPYPLNDALQRYEDELKTYIDRNGLN